MVNVVIPMAGEGSRFFEAGYTIPKPFLSLGFSSMIREVIENVADPEWNIYLICKAEHYSLLQPEIESLGGASGCHKNVTPIAIHQPTEGALMTVLKAREYINNPLPLLVANSDQYVVYDREKWKKDVESHTSMVMTFESDQPRWSYARLDDDGYITSVVEKQVVSNAATCGVYAFSSGELFCRLADQMIAEQDKSKGEYYLAPIYTRVAKEEKVINWPVGQMFGLGTPEDYEKNRYLVNEIIGDLEFEDYNRRAE